MNNYHTYCLQARLHQSAITPWQSDTIFGGFCWALAYLRGEQKLEEFLMSYRQGNPPVIFSNGFPGALLPKPLAGLESVQTSAVNKPELIAAYHAAKKIKKTVYLTLPEFQAFQSGRLVEIESKESPVVWADTAHNQIDRISGTTGESGALYSQAEWFVTKGELSVYLKILDGYEKETREIFEVLGQMGLGKKRSLSKGSFKVMDFAPFTGFNGVTEADSFVSLSNFVPSSGDPVEGSYKIIVKYGKAEPGSGPNPFKRPLIMLTPGAVFKVAGEVRPFYGRLVEKVAVNERICHYGLAFSVPAYLGWS